MKYIKTINDISNYLEHIPLTAIEDVKSRMGDYYMSNPNVTEEDAYIKQQLNYLDNIVKRSKSKEE